jgi:AcrR family transcriptional regulator
MALSVLESDGLEALTLAGIARRLDVTQPALYRHVGGFDELLRRLALIGRQRLLASLRDAAVGRSTDAAVAAVANAWRDFARTNPSLYLVTDRVPLAGDALNEAAAAEIVRVLVQVIDGYVLPAPEPERAAWALRSALHGFVDLELRSGNPSTLELDETFHRLIALLITGLNTWDAVARRGE